MPNISLRPSASPPAVHQLKISSVPLMLPDGLSGAACWHAARRSPRTTALAAAPVYLKSCRLVTLIHFPPVLAAAIIRLLNREVRAGHKPDPVVDGHLSGTEVALRL